MISRTSAERYAKAKKIFFAVLELDTAQHAEYIRQRCGGDADLRREVESLLAVRRDAEDFLKPPSFQPPSFYENLKNEIIGGYRLIREIGTGGMGLVFLAEKDDAEFPRRVALKLVKTDVYSKAVLKRFNLERRILSRLDHPNVARLIDGGKSRHGTPFLVMEYVEGTPFIEFAEANNLSLIERIELFLQICEAVSFAHKHAVIHRDLKPSNILVTSDRQVKLLDFGIAKLLSSTNLPQVKTETTFRAMTPEFASPEQIRGEPVTTASDIFSLGVVLYKLLTGVHPFKTDSENLNDVIHAVCEEEPTAPSRAVRCRDLEKNRRVSKGIAPSQLRGDLDNILLKTLRKKPERRYSSVEALAQDLRRYLDGLPVLARANTVFYRMQKFVRRNRLAAAFAVLGILALLTGGVAALWQARLAEEQRKRAEQRFNDVRALVNSFMFELNNEILKSQTQARELLVRRALEYLDSLSKEAKGDVSLQRELAVAYLKIGDIQGKPYSPNLGNTDGALESYRKSLSILENLNRLYPKDNEIKRDLALAYSSIGSLQETRKRDHLKAVQNLERARVLMEEAVAAEPENLQNRRHLSDVYKFIADLPAETTEEKVAGHQKALKIREELLAIEPESVPDLAAAASLYQRIGTAYKNQAEILSRKNKNDVQGALNSYRNALTNFEKSLSIYRHLTSIEPGNSRHRRNAADIMAMSLPVKANLGDKKGVLEDYQKAIEIFEKLSADDPKNFEARFDVAFTQDYMCRSLTKLDLFTEARQFCLQAVESGKSLLSIDPTNAEARFFVYYTSIFFADGLTREKNYADALKILHRLLSVVEQWSPDENASYIYNISLRIGNIYLEPLQKPKVAAKKRESCQTARRWLERSLEALYAHLELNGTKNEEMVREIKQKIAACDGVVNKK